MAETKSIRVKQVRAADPSLSFNIEIADGGTFPPFLMASAQMTGHPDGGSYNGASQAFQNPVSPLGVTITFSDPEYANETDLQYTITVSFSPDGRNWTPFSGDYGGTNSGDVTASQTVAAPQETEVVAEPVQPGTAAKSAPADTGGDLSRRKGCLGLFF